jgi:LmbE family N-acetylglucosaminyl deacetylase
MVVHAHPDDEAISTGGVLALSHDQGVRTVLVTCTNGELGDGPGGVKPDDPAFDEEKVVPMRLAELEESCRILGVDHLELLGFHDSGMMGWPQNDAPNAFWGVPVEEGAARLGALMDRYEPDVVVTYDENGFYGHPDHIKANQITVAALEGRPDVAKFYYTGIPRSAIVELGRLMRERGIPGPAQLTEEDGEAQLPPDVPEVGTPDELVTTFVDCSSAVERKRRSLEAHASQAENIFFLDMDDNLFAQVAGRESFVRVRDTTGAPIPESDLFAGLR